MGMFMDIRDYDYGHRDSIRMLCVATHVLMRLFIPTLNALHVGDGVKRLHYHTGV